MIAQDKNQAAHYIYQLVDKMMQSGGSDLFITANAPPSIKIKGEIEALSNNALSEQKSTLLVRSIMNDYQLKQFEAEMECNFSITAQNSQRFRVSAFTQRGHTGMVLRHIPNYIPSFEELSLPTVLRNITLAKRGLVLIVGSTASGKSTTMASMVDYRNHQSKGHIITLEDPIEFLHQHQKCLITQREIGLDTQGYEIALKNALRQTPDMIVLGEINDPETMEYAISYAETGHLCVSTLHANNANQAIERILSYFPEERHKRVLMELSFNLKAIISQRLIRHKDGQSRVAALEIITNTPAMAELVMQGDISGMKALAAKSNAQGMCTFDQSLFNLIEQGKIKMEDGLHQADSLTDLRLRLKLESRFAKGRDLLQGTEKLSIDMAD